jgi:hypothetical protein
MLVAPAAPCARDKRRKHTSEYRYAETFRPSLRDGLRLMAGSPRCTGLFSHRRLAESTPARLDPSVGRSGPHAFAVRFAPARCARPMRPSHPVSHVGSDWPNAPPGGIRIGGIKHTFLKNGSKIFPLATEICNPLETPHENSTLARAILRLPKCSLAVRRARPAPSTRQQR